MPIVTSITVAEPLVSAGPSPSSPRRQPAAPLRRRRGFTLPELMVIVVLLSILASVLVPTYLRYVYRSRRSEAYYALRAIYDAQTYHYANHGEYSGSFEELPFDLDGGTLRDDGAYDGHEYTYSLERWDLGDKPNANYRATATGNIDDSDDTLDIIIIENALTVKD
jgi:type IV pilus assembly protein PilE